MNKTTIGILGSVTALCACIGIGIAVAQTTNAPADQQTTINEETPYIPPADNTDSTVGSYSASDLDSLGQSICGAVGRGMGHSQAYDVLRSEKPGMTDGQADNIIRTAINAYCPQYAGRW